MVAAGGDGDRATGAEPGSGAAAVAVPDCVSSCNPLGESLGLALAALVLPMSDRKLASEPDTKPTPALIVERVGDMAGAVTRGGVKGAAAAADETDETMLSAGGLGAPLSLLAFAVTRSACWTPLAEEGATSSAEGDAWAALEAEEAIEACVDASLRAAGFVISGVISSERAVVSSRGCATSVTPASVLPSADLAWIPVGIDVATLEEAGAVAAGAAGEALGSGMACCMTDSDMGEPKEEDVAATAQSDGERAAWAGGGTRRCSRHDDQNASSCLSFCWNCSNMALFSSRAGLNTVRKEFT